MPREQPSIRIGHRIFCQGMANARGTACLASLLQDDVLPTVLLPKRWIIGYDGGNNTPVMSSRARLLNGFRTSELIKAEQCSRTSGPDAPSRYRDFPGMMNVRSPCGFFKKGTVRRNRLHHCIVDRYLVFQINILGILSADSKMCRCLLIKRRSHRMSNNSLYTRRFQKDAQQSLEIRGAARLF